MTKLTMHNVTEGDAILEDRMTNSICKAPSDEHRSKHKTHSVTIDNVSVCFFSVAWAVIVVH